MAKILCALYDDPVNGYPKSYPWDGIPKIDRYPGGQSAPTPKHIDFKPGELLGSVSGELGLRKFLEGLSTCRRKVTLFLLAVVTARQIVYPTRLGGSSEIPHSVGRGCRLSAASRTIT
jgi:hypothetical protein